MKVRLGSAAAVCAIWAGLGFAEPIALDERLELFVDRHLIESMDDARLRLHEPHPAGTVLAFDRPYEGKFCGYVTVIHDGPRYRMYYRGLPEARADGSTAEVTCYAESADGIAWTKPDLGLFEVDGSTANNVVLADLAPFSHNFSPFLDTRPGVDASERYKALAGTSRTGLHAFTSPDGLRWTQRDGGPVITEGAFDSQNVAFWSGSEEQYVCYFRTWSEGDYKGIRTISRTTSKDFQNWTPPEYMTFGETPLEHLYTNQTQPYVRAPHLYIATPMRFMPGRRVLTNAEAKALGVHVNDDGRGYASDCADAVFMTSRGGNAYDRTFMEGFIRPGTDLGNWASRAGMTALGVAQTSPTELSIYKQANYAQPTAHLVRYALRLDGFASVHGPYGGGTMTTKPLQIDGDHIEVNFATSAAGAIRCEVLDESDNPVDGFALDDSDELIGDRIQYPVTWRGNADSSALAGRTVRLRFHLNDADLYAIRAARN